MVAMRSLVASAMGESGVSCRVTEGASTLLCALAPDQAVAIVSELLSQAARSTQLELAYGEGEEGFIELLLAEAARGAALATARAEALGVEVTLLSSPSWLGGALTRVSLPRG